jgi:hypothetical protein
MAYRIGPMYAGYLSSDRVGEAGRYALRLRRASFPSDTRPSRQAQLEPLKLGKFLGAEQLGEQFVFFPVDGNFRVQMINYHSESREDNSWIAYAIEDGFCLARYVDLAEWGREKTWERLFECPHHEVKLDNLPLHRTAVFGSSGMGEQLTLDDWYATQPNGIWIVRQLPTSVPLAEDLVVCRPHTRTKLPLWSIVVFLDHPRDFTVEMIREAIEEK